MEIYIRNIKYTFLPLQMYQSSYDYLVKNNFKCIFKKSHEPLLKELHHQPDKQK